jgi:hypothetical protein
MSWLFSQALVEEYLGASSLDGELSAPLNGKPTQQAYCAPDKMTDILPPFPIWDDVQTFDGRPVARNC